MRCVLLRCWPVSRTFYMCDVSEVELGAHCSFISQKGLKLLQLLELCWDGSVHVECAGWIPLRMPCLEDGRWHWPLYCKQQVLRQEEAFFFFNCIFLLSGMFEITLTFQPSSRQIKI